MGMNRARWIALVCLLLCCGFSVVWGFSCARGVTGWADFKSVYYGTKSLLQRHDPYINSELNSVYRADGGDRLPEGIQESPVLGPYINIPTTSIFVAPFALLPWETAHLLWTIVTADSLILAAFLMWNLGARHAPHLSLFLICFLLVNSEILFCGGNPAGIVISLCVVAVWCFLEERYVPAGILCLAVSLAIKPHDAGLVWLYFLLAGGVYRKRALQSLLVMAAFAGLTFLWVTPIAPHWIEELHSNLSATSAPGGINEPGPASFSGRKASMVIDLQAAVSVFRDDPRIYNPVSYLICGSLLLVWSVRTLWLRFSQAGAWIALAAVVPLTMLVTYHRPWDAKLLLLAIPACALLWAEGGLIRWVALLVTAAGIVSTADIPLVILSIFSSHLQVGTAGIPGQILTLVLMQPVPLILLAMGIFYLWVYLRRDFRRVAASDRG